MKKLRLLIVFLVLVVPAISGATPITVTATGRVFTSIDSTNYFGLGIGSDTLLNAYITATWTFDTDETGLDLDPDIANARYEPGTDWMSSTVDIDTSTVDKSISPGELDGGEADSYDSLFIQNGIGSDGRDRYSIVDKDLIFDSTTGRIEVWSFAQVYSDINDLISTLDPAETLSWTVGSPDDYASGIFYYEDTTAHPGVWSFFSYQLDTFTVVASNVPEPSIPILLGLGLVGLGLRKRKVQCR